MTSSIFSSFLKNDSLTFTSRYFACWPDINFRDMPSITCNDFVFDNVKLHTCVLHYNCEKTYPVGRMHEGIFILRGDDKEHNGDCNPIHSINKLIDDNELTEVFDSFEIQSKNKKYKHYCVYGTNI